MPITGESTSNPTAATLRSKPCLIANSQPLGSTRRSSKTGMPAMCSSTIRLVVSSNSRGTIAIVSPRSSQRRTSRRRVLSGAAWKAKIACSAPVSSTIASNAAVEPSTGAWRLPTSTGDTGSSSTKPTPIRPSWGSSSRWRSSPAPTSPAPMISVRRPQTRRLRARRRAVAQAIRQTSSRVVASANWIAIRPAAVADGWVSVTRAATTIAAAAVEPRTAAARSRRLI